MEEEEALKVPANAATGDMCDVMVELFGVGVRRLAGDMRSEINEDEDEDTDDEGEGEVDHRRRSEAQNRFTNSEIDKKGMLPSGTFPSISKGNIWRHPPNPVTAMRPSAAGFGRKDTEH